MAALRPALLDTWNSATGGELPLAAPLWLQNVENDPSFRSGDCMVVEADGRMAGFALTRMLPPEEIAANPDIAYAAQVGFLMALVVRLELRRQGIGSELLSAAEYRLRGQGASVVTLSGPPGHLVPGPPADSDLSFWEQRGFARREIVVDLRRSLDDWTTQPPPEAVAAGHYSYRQGQPGEEGAIIAFLGRSFPGDWRYRTATRFARGYRPEDVTLMIDDAGVIQGFLCCYHPASGYYGPSVHWYEALRPEWGGMGPLGVAPDLRRTGRGLGLGLVAAAADYLYSLGVRDCAIDWTTLVDFYGKLGWQVWKRYQSFQHKQLE